MKSALNVNIDEGLNKKSEVFAKNVYSNMHFKSEFGSDTMDLNWLSEIEFACPYLDNIIRNPKLTLINEEDVVKIEKAKKITVDSVKDLSKHTQFIDKIDPITQEVKPSKILITRREETFSTYENRFIYTLITNLSRFLGKKESMLEEIEAKNDKVLEYAASTNTGGERITIELKVGAKELPKGKSGEDFSNEINSIKERVKKVRAYVSGWQRSEFISSLVRSHAPFVFPPIKKTNMILKNPNFQIAMKLWEFLQHYDESDKNGSAEGLDTTGNDILKEMLNDSFLMDYFVLDSISESKKEQKEKLCKYAVVMISQQIKRVISILLSNGIKITDQDILNMISNGMKDERNRRTVGNDDIKKKFEKEMDEYLERTKDYL